jgi:hypothetical protein
MYSLSMSLKPVYKNALAPIAHKTDCLGYFGKALKLNLEFVYVL